MYFGEDTQKTPKKKKKQKRLISETQNPKFLNFFLKVNFRCPNMSALKWQG
jgi:hypothetical protein